MFKRILIINPFGIGDVLFTTPIIHSLKDVFPEVKIGYLCNRRTAPILKNNPYIDYVFVYERDEFEKIRKKTIFLWFKKILTFITELKRAHFDLALDLSLNSQYGFFCWVAGISERLGYNFKGRGLFLTKKIPLLGFRDKHIVHYYAELLKYLGVELKYRKLELYLKGEDIKRIEDILEKEGLGLVTLFVGIIPGAGGSWGKDAYLKHWPIENFALLADKLVENQNAKIIIMGDSSEREIAQGITSRMRYKALDLTGKTSLGELAALLSKMHIVVTNDGGPLHIAVALGIKTVSIFGPVNEKVYGPYSTNDNYAVVRKNLPCQPCYQDFRMPKCERDRECINSINVEEVYNQINRLW